MANEAQREEEYMKKMLNRGKDSATTKKNVFGGGLEAARAKQSGGVITSSPVVTTTTPANTYKPPPVRTYNPPPPQSRYVPQSLEAEVTEVSLPYPGSSGYRYEPPDESSIALNSGLSKDEMAKREEERVAKSIGKFVPPVQAGGSGGSFGGPPKPPAAAPKSYHTTNYGGPSYSQPQSGSSYGQQSSGYSAAPAHGADYVYPGYQIGTIYPVDSNTNVLPLSPFGCAAHEITLTVRQNGKSLEVKRSVHQKGLPKNETKNITLPFQVMPHNTSASYNPNKNGGELSVFFGKSSDNSGETVVSTFTVYGSPSSHEVKVPMGAEQESDHFLFRPDSPAKYDTQFTVVLIGSILEFRSACTFEDDDGTKTLNTKQTVQLPITPSPEQIESNGDQIKIWFNRMVESNVGDFEVYITPVH